MQRGDFSSAEGSYHPRQAPASHDERTMEYGSQWRRLHSDQCGEALEVTLADSIVNYFVIFSLPFRLWS